MIRKTFKHLGEKGKQLQEKRMGEFWKLLDEIDGVLGEGVGEGEGKGEEKGEKKGRKHLTGDLSYIDIGVKGLTTGQLRLQ